MASESVASRINDASLSIDGVAQIVENLVQGKDGDTDRIAFACADLLRRISETLDSAVVDLERAEGAG